MKNTGIEYEELVKQLFQSIAKQDNVKNIDIRRNVILERKAGGTHQIDVFWEFESLGITHKVIIEAKDYKSKVTQEKLHAFKSVLEDIPGQPRGIYITKTGYQCGARKFAEHHGIKLYEFRQPNDKDWKDKIRNIYINVEYSIPNIKEIKLSIDCEWLSKFCKANNILLSKNHNFSAYSDSVFLYDKNDNKICSIQEKINALIQKHVTSAQSHEMNIPRNITEKFTQPTYINTLNEIIPKLKINGINFELHFSLSHDNIAICGDDIIKFILKDVIDGDVKRIGNYMQILESK